MRNKTRWIASAAIAIGVIGSGGAAMASSGAPGGDGERGETPITGPALERAGAVALESTGGGRVSDTEVRDEEGFYEVEVTLPDGSETDVHLTSDFTVIDTQAETGAE